MKTKKIVFDIDGTICTESFAQERIFAHPKQNIIDAINKLYSEGCVIILYTARGWDQFKLTEYWLKQNGVKYNLLMCGKPIYDYWVDDRSLHPDDIKKIID